MSANLLGKTAYAIGLTLWVVFALVVGQSLAAVIYSLVGLQDTAVSMTILAALGYLLALALALGVPALAKRKFVSLKTLAVDRAVSWSDIGLGILAILPYLIVSATILWIGTELIQVIDPDVGQQIPFQNITLRIEYFVAFITLVVMAPLAEELLFRGYFLGRLGERINKWLAVFVTALAFGAMHLVGANDSGIVLQWGAAADTFALGLVVGSLRYVTGSIWAGVILHAVKNGVAYYFLFIVPGL